MSLSRRPNLTVAPGLLPRQQLRKELLLWRESMPIDQNTLLSQSIGLQLRSQIRSQIRFQITQQLTNLFDASVAPTKRSKQARCIGVYWPIRGEPDLRQVYQELSDLGYVLALPFIKTDPNTQRPNPYLTYARWALNEPTVTGRYAIEQPQKITEITPDLILAPCVGFDKNGYRLGYGAGYFDNTLRQRPTYTIGIAFALTQIDDLHPSPSDVRLNAILTESAVHSFSD